MGPLLIRHGCHIDSSLAGWALAKERPEAYPESPQLRQWPPRSSAMSVGIRTFLPIFVPQCQV